MFKMRAESHSHLSVSAESREQQRAERGFVGGSQPLALATENDGLQLNMYVELMEAAFVGFSDRFHVCCCC